MENMDQEPVISRLDRLDSVLKQLEMIKFKGGYHSPKSSSASTTSSSASDGCSADECLEKYCRPIELVRMETGLKGTVIQRLAHIEDRLLKLEDEIEMEKRREALSSAGKTSNSSSPRKSLKQLVKSCVKGNNNK